MRKSTRLRAFDGIRNVFGGLKSKFESRRRRGLDQDRLTARWASKASAELMSPMEPRLLMDGLPNLILVPNQSVGGNLQKNMTPQIVDISSITNGALFIGIETKTIGQLYTLVRDPATGAALGVQQVGAITESNGSAVFNLAKSLATDGSGFFVIGSSGESYVPFESVGGDLGNDEPLSIKAMSVNGGAAGNQPIYVIDSDGASLRLYSLNRDIDGKVVGYDKIGQITDPVTGIPILGMTSIAVNPTSGDIVTIGARADQYAPSNSAGYIGDSFDVRALAVTSLDLTQNDQTFFINRKDPFTTDDQDPEFELWRVTRDPLTNAVLNTSLMGAVTDPNAGGANVLRLDTLSADPNTNLLYGIGIPMAVGSMPVLAVQGDLGDVFNVLDISATQFDSLIKSSYEASIDSIFAVVGNNTTSDLYRIRQAMSATPDPDSGISDPEGLSTTDPMQRIGQLVDTSGRPIYFAQSIAGSMIRNAFNYAESAGNDDYRYVWVAGSASPTAGSPMSLYKVDAVAYQSSPGGANPTVKAMEEYSLTIGNQNINGVITGLTQVAWKLDLWDAENGVAGADKIPDTHVFYAAVLDSKGVTSLYQIIDNSNTTDLFGNALPPIAFDTRVLGGNTSLLGVTGRDITSLEYYSANPKTGTLKGLAGKVGDEDRAVVTISMSNGAAGSGAEADPYLRGLTFLNFPGVFGDVDYKAQIYSVRGDSSLPQNDQLWTQVISTTYYEINSTTGQGTRKTSLLFNSSDPLAAPVDKTAELTDSQIRDWQIRPEKSDGFFKALTIDEEGVSWVVFEYEGEQYLATIEEEFTRSTDVGTYTQLNVRGKLATAGGPITNVQGLDFSRTGELIALDKPTTTSNRLIAINQLDPSNSLELVTDTTDNKGGTANLMSVLANHDTDGYTSNPLGRFLTIVPDDLNPVDQLNSPVGIIPNEQRPWGDINAQLNISDFVITNKVDFGTGQGKTYGIDYSTGTARLVQLVRDASGAFVNQNELFPGITSAIGKINLEIENWWGLAADPTGFLYGIGTNYTTPRPTGAVEPDKDLFNGVLDYGANANVAITGDGTKTYVMGQGGLFYVTERDTLGIDPFTGQASNQIISNTTLITTKTLLKGIDGKTAYSNFQGLEIDPSSNDTQLLTTAIDSSDSGRRVLLRLSNTGSIISRQYIVDLAIDRDVLTSTTLLASLNDGTGIDLDSAISFTFADGAKFSYTPGSSVRTVEELATQISVVTGGRGVLTILGDGTTAQLVLTDTTVGSTTMNTSTPLATFRNGTGINGNSASFSFNILDTDGATYQIDVDANSDGGGGLTVNDVIAAIKADTGGKVVAQISGAENSVLQLVSVTNAGGAFQVSDIGGSTAAADLGILQIVAPGESTITGVYPGSFRYQFSFSGQGAEDLKFSTTPTLSSAIVSAESLKPASVLTTDFLGLTFSPDGSAVYALARFKNPVDDLTYQRFVTFAANDSGDAVTLTHASNDLKYRPANAPETTEGSLPTFISGFSFTRNGQVVAIDHQFGEAFTLLFTGGIGTTFTVISNSVLPTRTDIWDLTTDSQWRVYSAAATQLLVNADTLYRISPTTGIATRLTDLVTDVESGGYAQATGTNLGNQLAFSPSGDLYIVTTYYGSSQLFKVNQTASAFTEQLLTPVGNFGGTYSPGEIGLGYEAFADSRRQGGFISDIEFTKTGVLVANAQIPFFYSYDGLPGATIPAATPFMLNVNLNDASVSNARSRVSDDGKTGAFTSAIDPNIVAFATDSQGVFYGIYADGVDSDQVWRGKADELYISNSDQALYKLDAANGNGELLQTLKDTSQVLQQPVADVFQSLLFIGGDLYGTLRDVRTNDINRLINFNLTGGALNGTYNRVGKSAGLITIDNGLAGFSNVNIDGLVYVDGKLIGTDRINDQLVTINFDLTNPASSETNLSAGLSSKGSMSSLLGLVSDSEGKIFSIFKNTAGPWQLWVNDFNQALYLYNVNSSNAEATNLGKLLDFDTQTPYEPGAFAGVVYDSAQSLLYGVIRNDATDGNPDDDGDYLVQISTKGDAQVFPLGIIQVSYGPTTLKNAVINSIEYLNGKIIAYDDGNPAGRQIITIDPANPGVSTIYVEANQPGINFLRSDLIGLAVEPAKGRLYSLLPGDGVSAGLAKYDQLFLSDRLYSYDESYTNLETDGTSANPPLQIDLPGLLANVWGVDPITGVTVQTPTNVKISEVLDSDGNVVANNSGQFVFTTVAGIQVTVFEDGRVFLNQTNFYNGGFEFSFRATNGTLTTAINTVTITIPEVNEAPIGTADDEAEINRDQSLSYDLSPLLANIYPGPRPAVDGGLEPDETVIKEIAQSISVTVSSGIGGTASLSGNIVTFVPNPGFVGRGSFTYTVTDNGTTNGAASPQSVTRTITVWVGTRPEVLLISDVVPNPTKVAVDTFDVTFAAKIDPTTFNFLDLLLQLNGNTITLDNAVTVTALDGTNTLFRIEGLDSFTGLDGEYVLTVDVTGIVDPSFNKNGLPQGNKSQDWVMDNTSPVVSDFPPFLPNPRNTVGPDSFFVNFNEAIPDADTASKVAGLVTFTADDLNVTLEFQGTVIVLDSSEFIVSPVEESKLLVGDIYGYTQWVITGLDLISTNEGLYTVSVLSGGYTDLAGNPSVAGPDDAESFIIDKTSPVVGKVGPVSPDPRNTPVTGSVVVVFNEPIPDADTAGQVPGLLTFDLSDLALSLGGTPVVLDDTVIITPVLSSKTQIGALEGYTQWTITGLENFTAPDGEYQITVLPTGITDLAGNKGVVSAGDTDTWVTDTVAPTTAGVGPIVPNPRNTPAPSNIIVTFTEAIPDAGEAARIPGLQSLENVDFTLLLNGVDLGISDSLVVFPIDASKIVIGDTYGYTQWAVEGLENVSSADGLYSLRVDVTKITDLAGNTGEPSAADAGDWTMDTVAPTITAVGPIVPDIRNTRISSVTVSFSESVKASTLQISNFTLTRNGVVVPLTGATLSPSTNGDTFTISGLEPITSQAGEYVITLNAAGVFDLANNQGVGTMSADWLVDLTQPQVIAVGPVTPNPRNTAVSTILVDFDKPIDPDSFSTANVANTLLLTLNVGGVVSKVDLTGVTITPDPLDQSLFTVGNLQGVTSLEGVYTFTALGTQVQDVAGNFGKNDLSTQWTTDLTNLLITSLGANISSPRNLPVSTVEVVFSETIKAETFTTSTVTLVKDGKNVPLTSDVKINALNDTQYQITGLSSLTSAEGNYTISVNTTLISDIAGNTGTGVVNKSWVTDLSPPIGSVAAPDITDRTNQPQRITVTYTDVAGVLASSIKSANLRIFGPNNYQADVILESITPDQNGSPITAVYVLSAPSGGWSALNNGAYNVVVNSSQVSDILDQSMPQSVLGTFQVNIIGQAVLDVTYNGAEFPSGSIASWGIKNVGETSSRSFVFNNSGDGTLLINSVKLPAGYKIIDGLTSTIPALTSDVLTIGLDTTQPRVANGQIIISTSAGVFVINAEGEVYRGLTFSASNPISFTDASGDKVTFSMTGPGTGTAFFNKAGNADADRVTLTGTTISSSFSVLVSNGRDTTIRHLTVGNTDVVTDQTSIGTINAKTTDIFASATITGAAKTISIGDVTNAAIDIGRSNSFSGDVSISAKLISDSTITSDIGIRTLTAYNWLDTVAGFDSALNAPYMGNMTIAGYAPSKIAGNFQADVNLLEPRTALGLNTARITGALTNSRWEVAGTGINSISTGSFSNFTVDQNTKINSIVTTSGGASGSISALSIGSINIRGAVNGLVLDLGTNASPNAIDLKSFVVQGNVTDLDMSTKGKVGTITFNGALTSKLFSESTIDIGNSLTSFSVYSINDSKFDIAGNANSFTVRKGDINETFVNAFAITNFTVTGNITNAQVNLGDQTLFSAKDHVPVVGVGVPNTLPAVTNFRVTGSIFDTAVMIGGNARTITVTKGMTDSDLNVIGNIVNFTTGAISNLNFIADQVGTFRATAGINNLLGGGIQAVVINNLTVTGNLVNTDISLGLGPATLKALGVLSVSGSIANVDLRSQGNIGTLTAASIRDSFIFAGVAPGVDNLPDSRTDFTSVSTNIGTVNLTGTGTTFARSYIAAGTLGRVALKSVDPVDSDGIFGVAAVTKVTNFSRTGAPTLSNVMTPGDYSATGNFRLRVIG